MKTLLAAVLYGALLPAAFAGAIVETVSRQLPGGEQTAGTTLYVDGGSLRVVTDEEAAEGPGSNAIIRNEVMYAIDHNRRTYAVLDRAAMKQIAESMNQAVANMKAQLDDMSPEKRATMERLLSASPRGPMRYRKTPRSEKVAGRSCRVWEGLQNERRLVEYCVVPYASIAGGAEIMGAMKNMITLMDEVFVVMDENGIKDAVFSNEWRGVRAIDGYPVLIRMFEHGRPVSEEVLKSARVAAVPASHFQVPAGYREEKVQPAAGAVQSEEEPQPSIDPKLPEE
jgi:hypothetical protein